MKALIGGEVRMELSDGTRIRAKVVDVQDNVRDQVAYELIEIIDLTTNSTNLKLGNFYATSLKDIRTVS